MRQLIVGRTFHRLGLRRMTRGHVAEKRQAARLALPLDVDDPHLAVRDLGPGTDELDLGDLARYHGEADLPADQIGRRPAQHRAGRGVRETDATERVGDEDTVAAALDDALEARLTRHQLPSQVDDLVAEVDDNGDVILGALVVVCHVHQVPAVTPTIAPSGSVSLGALTLYQHVRGELIPEHGLTFGRLQS